MASDRTVLLKKIKRLHLEMVTLLPAKRDSAWEKCLHKVREIVSEVALVEVPPGVVDYASCQDTMVRQNHSIDGRGGQDQAESEEVLENKSELTDEGEHTDEEDQTDEEEEQEPEGAEEEAGDGSALEQTNTDSAAINDDSWMDDNAQPIVVVGKVKHKRGKKKGKKVKKREKKALLAQAILDHGNTWR
jgi:hypothetical protein